MKWSPLDTLDVDWLPQAPPVLTLDLESCSRESTLPKYLLVLLLPAHNRIYSSRVQKVQPKWCFLDRRGTHLFCCRRLDWPMCGNLNLSPNPSRTLRPRSQMWLSWSLPAPRCPAGRRTTSYRHSELPLLYTQPERQGDFHFILVVLYECGRGRGGVFQTIRYHLINPLNDFLLCCFPTNQVNIKSTPSKLEILVTDLIRFGCSLPRRGGPIASREHRAVLPLH